MIRGVDGDVEGMAMLGMYCHPVELNFYLVILFVERYLNVLLISNEYLMP